AEPVTFGSRRLPRPSLWGSPFSRYSTSSRRPGAAPGDLSMAKSSKAEIALYGVGLFWIGLGAFGLLWLVGVIIVLSSGAAEARTKFESAKGSVEKASKTRPKTKAYLEPWNKHGEAFRKKKDEVWAVAWNQQKDTYTWPDGMAVIPQYPDDPWGADSGSDLNN